MFQNSEISAAKLHRNSKKISPRLIRARYARLLMLVRILFAKMSVLIEVTDKTLAPLNAPTVAVTGFVGYSNNRIINGDSANSYLCFGIIATVALIFFLIMLFFVRKRIKFSIAVIKESSR